MKKLSLLFSIIILAGCGERNLTLPYLHQNDDQYQRCMKHKGSFKHLPYDPGYCQHMYGGVPATVTGTLDYPAPQETPVQSAHAQPVRRVALASNSPKVIQAKASAPSYPVRNMAKPDFPSAPSPYQN